MIESDIPSIMSGIIRNSGQNHHPSQEYSKARNNSEILKTEKGLGLGVCCAFREESQTKNSGSCWLKQERSWCRNKLKGTVKLEFLHWKQGTH
ncbi:hypothetical protein DV515_00009382 [Chloebia gouldiae]|uniref:Uncharacterized protein n=1 Tax=Chloebia gouldiae TaxID=44316 RepID=A0A3L8SCC5_CHLGU|nr:hypothetical protein DV515_00009382 [Chloebia gouldiae]